MGGKVIVTCAKSGYSAVITFHTKPFYGGKLHKYVVHWVTAEVKHSVTGVVACRVQGEWNGVLEFSYPAAEGPGAVRLVDVTKLPVCRKHVRPVARQGPTESRAPLSHGEDPPPPLVARQGPLSHGLVGPWPLRPRLWSDGVLGTLRAPGAPGCGLTGCWGPSGGLEGPGGPGCGLTGCWGPSGGLEGPGAPAVV
ncbi:unnamed protein product [Gadus morhua 'NCC']